MAEWVGFERYWVLKALHVTDSGIQENGRNGHF